MGISVCLNLTIHNDFSDISDYNFTNFENKGVIIGWNETKIRASIQPSVTVSNWLRTQEVLGLKPGSKNCRLYQT